MADEKLTPAPPERSRDFVERYANNVRFETSFWDLKILYGIFDQSLQPPNAVIHTAMHAPWAQAKLMAYFLYVNVLFHEATSGEIKMPGQVPEPMKIPEALATDPKAQAIFERAERLRREMFNIKTAADGEAQER